MDTIARLTTRPSFVTSILARRERRLPTRQLMEDKAALDPQTTPDQQHGTFAVVDGQATPVASRRCCPQCGASKIRIILEKEVVITVTVSLPCICRKDGEYVAAEDTVTQSVKRMSTRWPNDGLGGHECDVRLDQDEKRMTSVPCPTCVKVARKRHKMVEVTERRTLSSLRRLICAACDATSEQPKTSEPSRTFRRYIEPGDFLPPALPADAQVEIDGLFDPQP